jgi:competence protein ComEC
MGLLLGIGILGGIAGIFYLSAGKLFLVPACLMLRIQLWICARVSALPGAMAIIGKPTAQIILCYYLILFCMIGLLRHRNFAARRIGLGACAAALFALLCVPKVRGIETDYLDVGQGDGIYLHTSSGASLFVDGGSSDVSKVGTYRMLPFLKAKGIRTIDYWLLSHADSDHTSGLLELLEADYPVGCLMVGENLRGQEEEVLTLAAEKEIPIVYLSAGDVLHLDEENVYLRVISPEGTESSDDANEESLVFFYEDQGFSTIFTGDIGETTERRLLADGVLEQVDVYKTAHHGSRYSNTSAFLEALSPKCAVVSCAKKNTYGHPSEEAIDHITASGAKLFLTMERGQVKVRADAKKGIVVETMY